jgi:alkylation response protein AidB-like acyl-CoA dehydrogenase
MEVPKNISDVIQAAQAIVPRLEASSLRSEQLRRLDDDAVAAMKEAGLARLFTPKQFGGFELPPRAHILSSATLAHGCSAASWVLMVCGAHTYVVGRYPEACQEEVFANPDVLIAGTLASQGTIERTAEGWLPAVSHGARTPALKTPRRSAERQQGRGTQGCRGKSALC